MAAGPPPVVNAVLSAAGQGSVLGGEEEEEEEGCLAACGPAERVCGSGDGQWQGGPQGGAVINAPSGDPAIAASGFPATATSGEPVPAATGVPATAASGAATATGHVSIHLRMEAGSGRVMRWMVRLFFLVIMGTMAWAIYYIVVAHQVRATPNHPTTSQPPNRQLSHNRYRQPTNQPTNQPTTAPPTTAPLHRSTTAPPNHPTAQPPDLLSRQATDPFLTWSQKPNPSRFILSVIAEAFTLTGLVGYCIRGYQAIILARPHHLDARRTSFYYVGLVNAMLVLGRNTCWLASCSITYFSTCHSLDPRAIALMWLRFSFETAWMSNLALMASLTLRWRRHRNRLAVAAVAAPGGGTSTKATTPGGSATARAPPSAAVHSSSSSRPVQVGQPPSSSIGSGGTVYNESLPADDSESMGPPQYGYIPGGLPPTQLSATTANQLAASLLLVDAPPLRRYLPGLVFWGVAQALIISGAVGLHLLVRDPLDPQGCMSIVQQPCDEYSTRVMNAVEYGLLTIYCIITVIIFVLGAVSVKQLSLVAFHRNRLAVIFSLMSFRFGTTTAATMVLTYALCIFAIPEQCGASIDMMMGMDATSLLLTFSAIFQASQVVPLSQDNAEPLVKAWCVVRARTHAHTTRTHMRDICGQGF